MRVVDMTPELNAILEQKLAGHWDPTPENYQLFFAVDFSLSPDDPLFYHLNTTTPEKITWMPDAATRGHVAALVRIMREIAWEDLKLDKSDFCLDARWSKLHQGRVCMRIDVVKSVPTHCSIKLTPPGFRDLISAFISFSSLDKVFIENSIENNEVLKETSSQQEARCTFPRSQAVALLYLMIHQPVAKINCAWYKCALVRALKAMEHKVPKYIDFLLDTDDMTQGVEIRDMRHSKSEAPVAMDATEKEPVGETYDEALRLASLILAGPSIVPLLGVLYAKDKLILDFGFVHVTITTSPFTGCEKICVRMGKFGRCGDLFTNDCQLVREMLVDTTKLTIHEMRLKYSERYQRMWQNANK